MIFSFPLLVVLLCSVPLIESVIVRMNYVVASLSPPPRAFPKRLQSILHQRTQTLAGCHIDLGYSHQDIAMSSEMIFSESFENSSLPTQISTWSTASAPEPQPNTTTWWTTTGSVSYSIGSSPFNGLQYVTLTTPPAAITNKGFHGWGFDFQAGKPYHGYFFVRRTSIGS